VTKLPIKPTWRHLIAILSTFLESPLNFLSHNLEKHKKLGTVKEKTAVKVCTAKISV